MDRICPFAYPTGGNINKSALTLVELLIGSAISLFVVAITIILYVMMQTSGQDTNAVLETERAANLAMERITRGLFDAKSYTLDGATKIRFVSGIDLKERSFYLENNQLIYDPDTSVGSNEKPLVDDISALVFAASAVNPSKAVQVGVSVSKSVKGISKTMSLSSTVFLRNA